jgi:L-asparaginase
MKLLVLLTGGTLLMSASRGGAYNLEQAFSRDLVAEVPALSRIAELDARLVFAMDSANMRPHDWQALAREVHAGIATARYDGVVVVHGTDTMAYSASALALMLGPLPCPVVFTGAQRPLAEARSDAAQNLVDACLVATLAVPEVVLAFGSRGLRGCRATKRDAWDYDAFDSPSAAPLVKLGIGVEVAPHVRAPAALGPLDARLETSVLAVRVFPGLDPKLVVGAVRTGVKGLVLEAYGTGTLPCLDGSLIPAIEESTGRGVPVVVVSQCLRGHVDLTRYEGAVLAARAGAISGGDMTVEAALAKLMLGLARYGPGEAFSKYFASSVVGERSVEGSPDRAS